MKAFRSRLKEVVEKKYGKMTHEQIAAATGITRRPTITVWMSDRPFTLLNMKVLEPLADWLDCEIEDLYEVIEIDNELSQEASAP